MDYIIDGPPLDALQCCPTWLLAHGAGAPMDSEFMNTFSQLTAEQDIRVIRFEFPYMAARRTTGKKAPPPRAEKLIPDFIACVDDIASKTDAPLFIGGKSMGGRIASMIADECLHKKLISGVICLGYPFHPIGKPDKLRTEHLKTLQTPTLICQGERDPFGTCQEVDIMELSSTIKIDWAADGNHDLKPRKASGKTHQDNLTQAANACASFIKRVSIS